MPIETFKAVSVLAVLGYTVLFLILFYGLKEIPANMISVFAAGAPFYTAFFNWLILGEKSYSILQIIGLFIVFIGLIYVVVNELLNKGVIKAASTKILRYR
jgi:drug/metabolite transporter (DMT)-like permease